MKQPKHCAICDQPITDKGRKYCAECRDWERQVNSSANAIKDEGCDHVIAYDRDIFDGTSMLCHLSLHTKSDEYSTEFRYCPMCGECIRDEQGRLIVGEAWEAGEDG